MSKPYIFPNAAAEFTYVRTYSRWIEEQKRRETWPETVDRFVNFITEERGDKIPAKVLKKIRKYILSMDVMPSMRFLWAAGPAAKQQNLCIYNCSFRAIDCPEAFSEALYILCCGTGLGFSVEEKYVSLLPAIPRLSSDGAGVHVVQDSKEGWADSLKQLILSLYSGKDLDMDYSLIRPKGSRLKTMGGRASGPAPLITLHSYVREAFSNAQGRKLTSLECHDIMCQIAEIVVVGGVRRSSLISLSDLSDASMRDAKNYPFPLRRNMSNNSAVYNNKPTAVEFLKEWASLASSGTGERGIFNLDGARLRSPERRNTGLIAGVNPCQPGFAKVTLASGKEKTFSELNIGDVLLSSGHQETVVLKKWSNGIKPVFAYEIKNNGVFIGTENHRVLLQKADGSWYKETIEAAYKNNIKILGIHEYESIISKVYLGEYEVFDITVSDDTHTYLTNGVFASNCGEIMLRNQGLCNLSEVIIRADDDADSLLDKVETATWLGVIQATFTDFPYLPEGWMNNANEERLLGVSLTGQFDNPGLLSSSILKAGKQKALKVAKHASEVMGIPMPAAITCVKPSGSVAQVSDSSSGVHPRYAKYYIRRYRISATDPLYKMMKAQGVEMTPENGQTAETADTWIVSFPVKAPANCKTRHDVTAIDQLKWYEKIMKNWCEHNASMTVYVRDNEWLEVGNWVYQNWDTVNGVSFLPYDNGHYQQAPNEEITKEEYEKLSKSFKSIDYSKLSEFEMNDNTEGAKSYSCTGDKCELA